MGGSSCAVLVLVTNRDFRLLSPDGDLDAVPCRLVPHRPEYYRSRVDEARRPSVTLTKEVSSRAVGFASIA